MKFVFISKMSYLFILLIYSFSVKCNVLLPEKVVQNEAIILTEIVGNYLHKYLNSHGVFLSIALSSSTTDQQRFQQDFVSNLVMDTKLNDFSFNILNTLDQSRLGNIDAFNLVLVDGSKSSLTWVLTGILHTIWIITQFHVRRQIFNKSTVQMFHLDQHYLIISSQNTNNIFKTMHDIFTTVMNLGLLDVDVVIKESNTSNWSIYSYKPYIKTCHSFEIERIDTFSPENYTKESNVAAVNLYGPRLFKFPWCWLYVSTFSFDPFVIIRNTSIGIITYSGIDVKIVNEIAKTLKLIPMYMQPSDGKNRGKIFKNKTATGAIKMVNVSRFLFS